MLQKLRARGAESRAAVSIERQLQRGDDVVLTPGEAATLLEELRESGRRWLSGTESPPEQELPVPTPPEAAPEPEPEPQRLAPEPEAHSETEAGSEPEPERRGWLSRLFKP